MASRTPSLLSSLMRWSRPSQCRLALSTPAGPIVGHANPLLARPRVSSPSSLQQPLSVRLSHSIPRPLSSSSPQQQPKPDADRPLESQPSHSGERPELNNPAYYQLSFTCVPCDYRSHHNISKQGYHSGSVLITCPGCRNRHVISDHLGIFGNKKLTVEDLMREKGQLVKRGSLGEDGDIEFWPDEDVQKASP